MAHPSDVEKGVSPRESVTETDVAESHPLKLATVWEKFKADFFESRGIQPVAVEDRTDERYINVFTLWVSMSLSVLPLPFGLLGTLTYGLSLRDSSLVIIFFSLLCAAPCAYLATLGPKLGLRQMIIARYSFGRYLVSIPILLNLATLVGFCVINDVLGGGILAAASDEGMSWNVGIVIVGLLGLLISGLGYRILHYYERFAWIAALICLTIMVGVGGKHLHKQAEAPPATASAVISYGGLMAGYFVPWAAVGADFSTYMRPEAPSSRIFLYTYCGLLVPSIPILILGAAIGGAVPNNPTWLAAYEAGAIGDILAAILEPVGRFGKFLLVIMAFSIIGNLSGTMYAVALNFQALLPWLVRVPRFVFVVITTIVMIPVAVEAAKSFFVNLENFVGVIGFWSAAWCAVVIVEHLLFRKRDPAQYSHSIWDTARELPTGIPAIAATALSFALVIPSMSQVWYVGPIGEKTGDLGFEFAFVISLLLYVPFRYLEIKIRGRV